MEGLLRCSRCDALYPITGGIAFLALDNNYYPGTVFSKYERPDIISSYLWSHFGDIMEEDEASTAYNQWAAQLTPGSGPALDTGCAVGRFTFEMARKFDFAVGIDNSVGFIRAARELLLNRRLRFSIVEEGKIYRQGVAALPAQWDTDRVEFIVADAQALPFSSNLFSSVASLNLIDKIPRPLAHLREVDRVARRSKAQLIVSDPFSWSSDISPEENWLGGLHEGEYSGRGIDNVALLLEGKGQLLSLPWTIEVRGCLWWKIRNHSNHFELIRSHFIKARR